MKEAVEVLSTQDVPRFASFLESCICWTRGRMDAAIKSLLGPDKSRLAWFLLHLVPVTPNLLLLVKTTSPPQDPDKYEDRPDKFVNKQKMLDGTSGSAGICLPPIIQQVEEGSPGDHGPQAVG